MKSKKNDSSLTGMTSFVLSYLYKPYYIVFHVSLWYFTYICPIFQNKGQKNDLLCHNFNLMNRYPYPQSRYFDLWGPE